MKRSCLHHTKMGALVAELGVPLYAAAGVLEVIWHLTAREAPQGNIGKLSDAAIARWVGWADDPARLVAALVNSGWLDKSDTHRLVVHDWHEHADDAVKKSLLRQKLPFLSRHVEKCPDMSRLPEPLPVPEPVPLTPKPPDGPPLSPLAAHEPPPGVDLSVMNRVLCEKVGIFDMRQQSDLHRMFDSYLRHTEGLSMGDAVEHMHGRWLEYQRAGPELKWRYGSAHRFFMSGIWDKPDAWERKDGTSNGRAGPKEPCPVIESKDSTETAAWFAAKAREKQQAGKPLTEIERNLLAADA